MKFSYSILKKIAPRLPSKEKLAELINNHSFEVESVKGDTIDIKLYANRYSDAASHIGIARELTAALRLPFKSPVSRIVNAPEKKGLVKVKVEDVVACPRYAVRVFDIPKIPPTPPWTKKALESCGIKSINGVVDVMNYVMIEVGQPLHAFDAEKISGENTKQIIVRRAKKGEKIETLDGQNLVLDSSVLVIADTTKALAIAGVKGGSFSGVHGTGPHRIMVEAGNFDATAIYKTRRSLNLLTDAAQHFMHGISPALVDQGLDRATELLVAMGAKLKDTVDVYPKPVRESVVGFDPMHYQKLVGAPISGANAKAHFLSLGFSIDTKKKKSDGFFVRIPAWRTDIEHEEDVIEEVARLEGHNKLTSRAPHFEMAPLHESDEVALHDLVRDTLVRLGMDEIYTHSFAERHAENSVEVRNPISKEFGFLRSNLRTGIMTSLKDNNRFFEEVRVFELGRVFEWQGSEIHEAVHVGIGISKKKESPFREVKGIVEELLSSIGISEFDFVEFGKYLRIESGHHVLGVIDYEDLGKGWKGSSMEIDLEKTLKLVVEGRGYAPLPRYPSVARDASLLVLRTTRIGDVIKTMQDAGSQILESIHLLDEYVDDSLAGKQSLTFRLVFQSAERTLTDQEVSEEFEKIIHTVKKQFHADIR